MGNTYEIYYSSYKYFDEVNIENENLKDHKDYLYFRCPVWNHLFSRTFILRSPVDLEIKINSGSIDCKFDNEPIVKTEFLNKQYDRNTIQTELITAYIPDLLNQHPIVQVYFSDICLWTPSNLNYVWFEFGDHPMTALKNNFTSLSGWFNIANHPRTTSLGIKFVDRNKPVIIKKGDPLYRIRFYTENLNDIPVLIKKDSSQFPNNKMMKNVSEIRSNPEKLNSLLFEKL